MKQALEAGACFWSAAEYYGTAEYNSLHLLAAYFEKYPEDASRVILSLKIGMEPSTGKLVCDEEGIHRSYETCERVLGQHKRIDILSCARIDPATPVEVSIGALNKLVEEGKVNAIGISECSAATLRRASKVTKIAAVEVEFSMSTPDILTNGVAEAARETGAVIAAYAPLGRGLLTGTVSGFDALDENDPRRRMPRFAKEALEANLRLVNEVTTVSSKIGATKGQVALEWVRAHSEQGDLPQILPIPGTVRKERLEENMAKVALDGNDIKELDDIIARFPVVGNRYPGAVDALNWG